MEKVARDVSAQVTYKRRPEVKHRATHTSNSEKMLGKEVELYMQWSWVRTL